MLGKARYIFAAIQSGIMTFLMTFIVTAINVGFPSDFLSRWGHAFILAWPFAFCAALVARPFAQRGTEAVMAWLGGERT